MAEHHLFFSYARADNTPVPDGGGTGWVTAFKRELERRHAAYSGRPLNIFFDVEDIAEGTDWRRRLGEGLRQSKLFLAFLSPNYITSLNCLWEWEEYLRREHSAARGDDGLTSIFFVEPTDLSLGDRQAIAEWLGHMQRKYPWFLIRESVPHAERMVREFSRDIARRQQSPRHRVELHPWFRYGPEILREIDAFERSDRLTRSPLCTGCERSSLAQRLAALDRHISHRLDRIALAGLAPGNLPRGHEHFVGRHRELRQLHDNMITGGREGGPRGPGGRGMIAAAFAPGGLGKTALARQYAHAYAEFYAAGGTWEIACEGFGTLGTALARLAQSGPFLRACELGFDVAAQRMVYVTTPLQLSDTDRSDDELIVDRVLDYLRRVTHSRAARLREQLGRVAEIHSPADDPPELQQPRALLIFDNVDRPELFSARQMSRLRSEAWLEIIVTTRLPPSRFGGERSFTPLEVGTLPEQDAVRLLADFQPRHHFQSPEEEEAATRIARTLGGWTIALEIAAAFLGDQTRRGNANAFTLFLTELEREGLAWIDDLAGLQAFDQTQRHSEAAEHRQRERHNRVGSLIDWSMRQLSPPARSILEFASLLMPDAMPLEWLRELEQSSHRDRRFIGSLSAWLGRVSHLLPVGLAAPSDSSARVNGAWPSAYHELRGLRLLHPADSDDREVESVPEMVRIHRLVAARVAAKAPANRLPAIESFLDDIASRIELQVGKGNDESLRRQLPWMRDQLEHLLSAGKPSPMMLESAGVAARYEGFHGSLARAITLTEQILRYSEAWLAKKPRNRDRRRAVAVSLDNLATFLSTRGRPGDLELVLAYHQRSLELKTRIIQDGDHSLRAARDRDVSLHQLATFFATRGNLGDIDLAVGHCQAFLDGVESRLGDAPQAFESTRDLTVVLNNLGGLLLTRGHSGDSERAFQLFSKSIEVSEQLLTDSPDSSEAKSSLASALVKMGTQLRKRQRPGDDAVARKHLTRALEIRGQLLTDSPESTMAQRDCAAALIALGDLMRDSDLPGDSTAALGHYMRSVDLFEQLLTVNPDSAVARKDLLVGLHRATASRRKRADPGDTDRILRDLTRCLEIEEQLLENSPESEESLCRVVSTLDALTSLLADGVRPNDVELARVHFLRLLELRHRLLDVNPDAVEAKRAMMKSLVQFSQFEGRQPGGEQRSFDLQKQSLGLAVSLRAASPESVPDAEDAASSYYLAHRRALAAGDDELAAVYLHQCFQLLESLSAAGTLQAPDLTELHIWLKTSVMDR